ncbi:hypothetical protein F5J12DRAFT_863565 [Pisolithus orientalis]|uniref:uncharacterized protein n=1 Tax=Pisolithus orientalis TaxID=936130 RepID=UPI0022242E62|nr:uncharacterized protein F5J12DRAFT_863565 [Pisolithus orientalis]KAI5989788.1 hypothetical protein F5J12DRAFT_863565 [Pisolithus orientalis]
MHHSEAYQLLRSATFWMDDLLYESLDSTPQFSSNNSVLMSKPLPVGDIQKSTFVGFNIALLMFGVSLCQNYYYFRMFPKDNIFQKCLVGLIWVGSTFQIYCMITLQGHFLVTGHHSDPGNLPALPWQGTANAVQMFSIPFIVQCFYGWRLWIISGGNVLLVASVILFSAATFLSSVGFIFGLELPMFALRAAFSATGVIADVLITGSVYYYLRPSRYGMKRAETAVQHIVTVTINMGALTSIIALWLWITWLTQGAIPPISTPLMITSQSYVNSILAVLNARAQEPQRPRSPDKPLTFGLMSLSIPEHLSSRRKKSVCPLDAPECAVAA